MDKIVNVYKRPWDLKDIRFWVNPEDDRANAIVTFNGKKTRLRAGIIIMKGDQILLSEESDEPGVFSLPGGSLDLDETLIEAAKREAEEEVGIVCKDIEEAGIDYCECHDEVKDWVKEHVPEKEWWYNYYTCLCIGEYAREYKGHVDAVDQDKAMKRAAKFYPLSEIIENPSFKEAWKIALYNYGYIDEEPQKITEAYTSDTVKLNTAGYIKPDGNIIILDEYHGEDPSLRDLGYAEFSNTHPEVDTCVRIYKEPTTGQLKQLERIIDLYLDTENYCKVEIWNNGKYQFYKVFSLVEDACDDCYFEEEIGNWTGYKLVQIIKNYYANKNNINEKIIPAENKVIVYHGTPFKSSADSIKQHGLDVSKSTMTNGGAGNMQSIPGLNYISKNKADAVRYANMDKKEPIGYVFTFEIDKTDLLPDEDDLGRQLYKNKTNPKYQSIINKLSPELKDKLMADNKGDFELLADIGKYLFDKLDKKELDLIINNSITYTTRKALIPIRMETINKKNIEYKGNQDEYEKAHLELLTEKIVKVGSKWQVQSEKGRNMGTYDTEEEAKKRLQQIHYFKHLNESLEDIKKTLKSFGFEHSENGLEHLFKTDSDLSNFIRFDLDDKNKTIRIKGFGVEERGKGLGGKVITTILNNIPSGFTVELENNFNPDFWHHIESKYPNLKFKDVVKNLSEGLLVEKTRGSLITQSKGGDSYSGKKGNRWTQKSKCSVANTVADYNRIDMNTFFKEDTLKFIVKVKGETGDYNVTISFKSILPKIQRKIKDNKNLLEYRCIYDALIQAVNSGDILVDCDCPDYKHRFAYWASKHGYEAGKPETRAADDTNPNDSKGAACKHVLAVLNNVEWIKKIASVINNYINYCKENLQDAYAKHIFPKLYNMTYDKAVQLTIDDFDDKGELKKDLDTDQATINLANALGRVRGRIKKGSNKNPAAKK